MKNIVREVVAVSKTAFLVGIILFVAVGGALAYMYLSRTPSTVSFYDENRKVTNFISNEDGGIIETTGCPRAYHSGNITGLSLSFSFSASDKSC